MGTSDKRELTLVARLTDIVTRPLKNIGDQADDTKDDLDKVNQGLKKLDEQSTATTKSIEGLRKEVAKSGDLELIKDIAKQEARLKQFARQRKLLGDDAGGDAADGFFARFSQRIGPLLLSAPISPPLVAAASAAAPALSMVIAGAVTAGVGAGVAGIGVKLAAGDPVVQAAGKQMGAEFSRGLTDAVQPFVPETIKAIDTIRDEFQDLRPELRGLFSDGAKYVEPLTRAVAGFAREILPGLRDATQAAEPLIEVLAEHGPKAAEAFSNALTALSKNSEQNALALDATFNAIEFGVESAATNINLLTQSMPIYGQALLKFAAGGDEGARALLTIPSAADKAAASIGGTGNASVRTAEEMDTLTASVNKFTGDAMRSMEATDALEAAIDDATASVKENGKTFDAGTEKGRANRDALRDIAGAANEAAAAVLEQTGSQDLANAASERGQAAFLKAAAAMGVGKAEAHKLADALFALPVSKNITVTVDPRQALAQARAVVAQINNMKARISVSTAKAGTFAGPAHSGFGNSPGMATGGPVTGPGPKGVDSVWRKLAPGEHVWSDEDVDAAGGQAAVERLRRQVRSGRSATVGGASVGVSGGASVVYNINVNAAGATNPAEVGRATVEAIRAYEQTSGKGWRQ